MLNLNEEYIVETTGYAGQGRCITRFDNLVVFVDGSLPNETLKVEIIKLYKNYAEAKIVDIITASPFRVKPVCKFFLECGGCDLMHCKYDEQVKLKEEHLAGILNKTLKTEFKLLETVKAQSELNYRNNSQYKVCGNKIGFYKKDSHEIVSIDECKIAHSKDKEFLKWAAEKNIEKDFVLKNGMVLKDNETTIMELGNLKFLAGSYTFFQVNLEMAQKLYNYIKEIVIKDKNVLDLFCGVGSIGLFIADCSKSVLGVEVVRESIELAKQNAKLNNIGNSEFKCEKAENIIISNNIDIVIVDPPRAGLDKKLIEKLVKSKIKQLVYVSCNPSSFAYDAGLLVSGGFKLKTIKAFDMFPQTQHLEIAADFYRE